METPGQDRAPARSRQGQILAAGAWLVALSLLGVAVYLGWQAFQNQSLPGPNRQEPQTAHLAPVSSGAALPVESLPTPQAPAAGKALDAPLSRRIDVHTIFPNRPRQEVSDYLVDQGDSVFEIAARFNVKPETVLWANYDQLNDNPDLIALGMQLKIPPTDGVLYLWQPGDSLEAVAGRFQAAVQDILTWSGNQLDLTAPAPAPGALVMIPGGRREFRQWIIPTIPRGAAGVSRAVYGAGACEGTLTGAVGSGAFVWPAGNHVLSGNDYWNGHLGIDIAAGEGAPIYAADAGVVVFSGWANGGYGNMIMIDHGNGYQTLYGHLSSIVVGCGRSLAAGNLMGYSGSTGNSTGPHLHFEVRYQGGFINPWYVLPAP